MEEVDPNIAEVSQDTDKLTTEDEKLLAEIRITLTDPVFTSTYGLGGVMSLENAQKLTLAGRQQLMTEIVQKLTTGELTDEQVYGRQFNAGLQ